MFTLMMVGMSVGMFTATDRSKLGGKGHCNGRSLFVGRVMSSHVEPLVEKTKAKTAANVDMAFLTAAQNLVEMRTGGWQRQRNGWQFCGKATEGCFLVGGLEHFVFFHNIWDNPSHRLIFFKMVKTTNQYIIDCCLS